VRRPQLLLVLLVSLLAFGHTAGAEDGTSVVLQGRLTTSHGDDFARHRAAFSYQLATDNGTYDLRFAGGAPQLPQATQVEVRGQQMGQSVVVGPGDLAADPVASAPTPAGSKKVLVLLVNFSNDTSQPYTASFATGVVFSNANSVAAYYREVSWGGLSLSGDVRGWYTIAAGNSTCDPDTWANQADQAAAAAGVNLSAYDYHLYALSSTPACWWGGYAYIPGTRAWLSGEYGMSLYVAAHELGHNFGTHHAGSYSCTENGTPVSLSANSANCSTNEYGDPNSVMGSGNTRQQSNFARGNYRWLTTTNTRDVVQSGSYTLGAVEPYAPSAVQALRIPRSSASCSATYLDLELRQPYGTYFDNFASTDPSVNGVLVRLVPGYGTLSQSWLVDATPATADIGDAALKVGASLYDPARDVRLTVQTLSSGSASVQVSFGPKADTVAPSAPSRPKATVSKRVVTLKWSASTDNVGVDCYTIYRNGSAIASVPASYLAFTDYGALSGVNTYAVAAVDRSRNTGALSSAVSVTLS
jgi:hypothetical protein